MKTTLIYATKTGNTVPVAETIAAAAGAELYTAAGFTAASAALEDTDLLILGSGVFYGRMNDELLAVLKKLGQGLVKYNPGMKVAFFTTWLGRGESNARAVERAAAFLPDSMELLDGSFSCLGRSFGLIRKGHPDAAELEAAAEWGRGLASK